MDMDMDMEIQEVRAIFKRMVGELTLPNFRTCYKAIVMNKL